MKQSEACPRIEIMLSAGFDAPDILRDIVSGLEEEAIPYRARVGEEQDAVALAYRGAEQSPLDVGIGVDASGGLAVHARQLPPDQPLFLLNYRSQRRQVRSACGNAARLVKRLPFIMERG